MDEKIKTKNYKIKKLDLGLKLEFSASNQDSFYYTSIMEAIWTLKKMFWVFQLHRNYTQNSKYTIIFKREKVDLVSSCENVSFSVDNIFLYNKRKQIYVFSEMLKQ